MRIVLQRVKEASVSVAGEEKSSIGKGFLLLVGVGKDDTAKEALILAQKISKLRIFVDDQGKMNLGLKDAGGEVLSVPQFTLLGETNKGNRPGFDLAAPPEEAKALWQEFNRMLTKEGINVSEGEFGEHMEVRLVNDGPVTFVLDSK